MYFVIALYFYGFFFMLFLEINIEFIYSRFSNEHKVIRLTPSPSKALEPCTLSPASLILVLNDL